jgi:hypothetical protein
MEDDAPGMLTEQEVENIIQAKFYGKDADH